MTRVARGFVSLWNRALFAPTDARPMGLMRIGVGCILALQLLERIACARSGYSNEGYLPSSLARQFVSSWQWSLFWVLDEPWFVQTLLAIGAASSLLFALGWWTRAAGMVAFIVTVSLHNRNAIMMYGGDMLPRYFLFYLLLMPSDAAFSLTALRRRLARARNAVASGSDPRHTPDRPTFEVWPVRLFQIQVFLIYLFTGINKAYGTDYQEGVTLWYALVNPTFSRFYPELVPVYRTLAPVLETASVVTLWWELALPFMLLFRPLRVLGLSIGIFVHGGIAVLMQIGWWGPLMLLSYLAFITGRPFRRARIAHVRELRADAPRVQRLLIQYDPADARACELVARVAAMDAAQLVRLRASASAGESAWRGFCDGRELAPAEVLLGLRARLPWSGRWVVAAARRA